MGKTAIIRCRCENKGQDALCGKGRRVHNWARSALATGAWRCTVCGTERKDREVEPG